jgi:Domain of unknown function (DUF4397)
MLKSPLNMLLAGWRSMFAKPLHLDRPTGLVAALAVLGTLTLTGCQAIVSTEPQAQVRIIHATPDASGLDIYQGPNALAFNLSFGTVTSYVPLTPGTYTINADAAGSRQTLSSAKTAFAASTQYTVLIGNSINNLQQLTLTDQSQAAPSGQIALRFIDQATRTSAVDVYLVPAGQKLAAVAPLVTGIAFGANTGYLNVPTGAYSLIMVPTGTVPTSGISATYTGPQITYAAGAARTIILIDQPLVTTPGLRVITASDFDSPGTSD